MQLWQIASILYKETRETTLVKNITFIMIICIKASLEKNRFNERNWVISNDESCQFFNVNNSWHMVEACLLQISILAIYWSVTEWKKNKCKEARFTEARSPADGAALPRARKAIMMGNLALQPYSRWNDDRWKNDQNKSYGACSYTRFSSGYSPGRGLLKWMPSKTSKSGILY